MTGMKAIKKIDRALLTLVALVAIGVAAAMLTGGWQLTWDGIVQTGQVVNSVWLRLLLGFTLGGLIQVMVPHAMIARWLGETAGLKGILVGSFIGMIIPIGGPMVYIPIVASIYRAGAGVGPVVALLVGRELLGIVNLVTWHIPFLGLKIAMAKHIAGLLIPPLAGVAGAAVFRAMTRLSRHAETDKPDSSVPEQEDESGRVPRASGEA